MLRGVAQEKLIGLSWVAEMDGLQTRELESDYPDVRRAARTPTFCTPPLGYAFSKRLTSPNKGSHECSFAKSHS